MAWMTFMNSIETIVQNTNYTIIVGLSMDDVHQLN